MAFRIPQASQGGRGAAPLQRVTLPDKKSDQRARLVSTVAGFATSVAQQLVTDKINKTRREKANAKAKTDSDALREDRKAEARARDSAVLDARTAFTQGVGESDRAIQDSINSGEIFAEGTSDERAIEVAKDISAQTGEDTDTILDGIADPDAKLSARKAIEPQVVARTNNLIDGVRAAFKGKRINDFGATLADAAVEAVTTQDTESLEFLKQGITDNADLNAGQKKQFREQLSGLAYQGAVSGLNSPDPSTSARALNAISAGALDNVLEPADKQNLLVQAPTVAANLVRNVELKLRNFTTEAADPTAELPRQGEEIKAMLGAASTFLPGVKQRSLSIEQRVDGVIKTQAAAQVLAARRRSGLDGFRERVGGNAIELASQYDRVTTSKQLAAATTAEEGAQVVLDFYQRWPERHTKSAQALLGELDAQFGAAGTETLAASLSRVMGPAKVQMQADLKAEISATAATSKGKRAGGSPIEPLTSTDQNAASVLNGLDKAGEIRVTSALDAMFKPDDSTDAERFKKLAPDDKAFEVVTQQVETALDELVKESGLKVDLSDKRMIVNMVIDKHDTIMAALSDWAAADPLDPATSTIPFKSVMQIAVQGLMANVQPEPLSGGAVKRNSVSSRWPRAKSDVQRQINFTPRLAGLEDSLANDFDSEQPGGDPRFPMAAILDYDIVEEWGTDNVTPEGEGPVNRPYGAKITVVAKNIEGNRQTIMDPDTGEPFVFEIGAASQATTSIPGGKIVDIPPQARRLGNIIDPDSLATLPPLNGLFNEAVSIEPVPGDSTKVRVRSASLTPLGNVLSRTWRNLTKASAGSETRLQAKEKAFVGDMAAKVILGAFDIEKKKDPLLSGLAGNLGANSEMVDVSEFASEWGGMLYPDELFNSQPNHLDIPDIKVTEDLMDEVRTALERQLVTGSMPPSASWAVDDQLAAFEGALTVRRGEVAAQTRPDSDNPMSPETFAAFAADDALITENITAARKRLNQAKYLDMRDRAFAGDPHVEDFWGTIGLYEQFNDMASYLNYLGTDLPTNPLSAKDVRRMIGQWEESQDAADWLILDTGFRRQFLPEGF